MQMMGIFELFIILWWGIGESKRLSDCIFAKMRIDQSPHAS